jgi:hypothetical protein
VNADGVATAVTAGAQPGGAAFNLDQQVGVIQFASRAFFTFPYHGGLARRRRVFPAIQTASDDIERPADTPPRPFHAARKVDDPVVRLVESDVEEAKDLFGEPFDVGDRATIEFFERPEAAEGDEARQLRARNHIIGRAPGHGVIIT